MSKLKQWWDDYGPTGGSHVIWAARIHAALAFVFVVFQVTVTVVHDGGFLAAIISDRALLGEANVVLGVMYELLRRYKSDDF